MSDAHRIVAEVSKTWTNGHSSTTGLLSQRFEGVIEVNRQKGYELESWQFSQSRDGTQFVETIIAVFVRTIGNN